MSKILISYRREDSADVTGRIYDRLIQQFGPEAVFKDVDSIPFGVDFRIHLDAQVAKCEVFLAVIGRDWMRGGRKGESRLHDRTDFVRLEIESALKREIPVIPVLVDGATIPPAEQLPESIQNLSDRNGIAVRSDLDFHRDMDRLIEQLKNLLPAAPGEVPSQSPAEAKQPIDAEPQNPIPVESRPRANRASAEGKIGEGVDRGLHWSTWLGRGLRIGAFGGSLALFLFIAWTMTQWGLKELNASSTPTRDPPLCETLSALGPEMILVPSGSFQMGAASDKGSADAAPRHSVAIRAVAIGTCEVTFDEYDRFVRATSRSVPNDVGWGRGRRPVIDVSWEDAQAYAAWLSQQTGKRYRLPTEAEWEYAARSGGRDEIWAGTSDEKQLPDYAAYDPNSKGRTMAVGAKKPNDFGLYDMSGNVWEWVEDCWHETYSDAPSDGSAWLEAGSGNCRPRVYRGGSVNSVPEYLHVSSRNRQYAGDRLGHIGFRLAQDIP